MLMIKVGARRHAYPKPGDAPMSGRPENLSESTVASLVAAANGTSSRAGCVCSDERRSRHCRLLAPPYQARTRRKRYPAGRLATVVLLLYVARPRYQSYRRSRDDSCGTRCPPNRFCQPPPHSTPRCAQPSSPQSPKSRNSGKVEDLRPLLWHSTVAPSSRRFLVMLAYRPISKGTNDDLPTAVFHAGRYPRHLIAVRLR